MKTIKTLTAALLIMLSASAFADENNVEVKKNTNPSHSIAAPEFVWGSPVAIAQPEASTTKVTFIALPAFTWGAADEIQNLNILNNKTTIILPEFVWGSPADIN